MYFVHHSVVLAQNDRVVVAKDEEFSVKITLKKSIKVKECVRRSADILAGMMYTRYINMKIVPCCDIFSEEAGVIVERICHARQPEITNLKKWKKVIGNTQILPTC